MIGHILTIETDGTQGRTTVTLDGKSINTIALEVESRIAPGQAYLRFVTQMPDAPMPDLSKEVGSVTRNEEGHIEVEFGSQF